MRPVKFTAADQDFLSLSRSDDYFSVVRKLGPPAEDRWRPRSGVLQYRVLAYPQRGYSVVLLGTDKNDARYIGALDRNWQVVHFVDLSGGGNTGSMLRGSAEVLNLQSQEPTIALTLRAWASVSHHYEKNLPASSLGRCRGDGGGSLSGRSRSTAESTSTASGWCWRRRAPMPSAIASTPSSSPRA